MKNTFFNISQNKNRNKINYNNSNKKGAKRFSNVRG